MCPDHPPRLRAQLEVVTRKKMKITKKDLSDSGLKALWCVLDKDNSDNINATEFSGFMSIEGQGAMKKGASEARQQLLIQQAQERRADRPQRLSGDAALHGRHHALEHDS